MEAEKFMAAQPQVMALFTKFALEMAATGNRFGAKLIAERVRWEVATTWAADERGFKLNNNHTAYIARALIEKHQSLEGLMTCRRTVY
jgi:hypothetical protein